MAKSSVSNRLDQIEDEIRQLLIIQKRHNEMCATDQSNDKSRTKSSSAISGQSFTSARTTSPQLIPNDAIRKSKSESEEISRSNSNLLDFQDVDCDRETIRCKSRKKVMFCCACDRSTEGSTKQKLDQPKDLEVEVACLRNLVDELKLGRDTALESCQQWKEKYNEVKECACSCKKTWQAILAEKNCLEKSLEQERKKLQEAELQLHNSEEKIDDYYLIRKNYEEVLKRLNDKEKQIKDAEHMNAKLKTTCMNIAEELKSTKHKFKGLEKTNKLFAKDIVNKYECFATESTIICKSQNAKSQMLIDHLKSINEKNEKKLLTEKEVNEALKNQLRDVQSDAVEREQMQSEEMAHLEEQIKLLQINYEKMRDETDNNINIIMSEKLKAENMCADLQNQIQNKEQTISVCFSNCETLERELEHVKNAAIEKENKFHAEITAQRSLVQELNSILKGHQTHIEDIVNLNNQLKLTSEEEASKLAKKCEQLKIVEQKFQNMSMRHEKLQDHIEKQKLNCNDSKKAGMAVVENQIKDLKELLQKENANVMIKDKILNDQANTIMLLKKKISEKDDVVANLYKEINLMKKEKNELNLRISEVDRDNNSLTQNILKAQKDLNRQHIIIGNLERNLALQHKEWELQSELFVKEKERAVSAAKFATEKLVETMHDFQKQTNSQNQVRNVLTNMLQEKDDKLKTAIVKISSLNLDPGRGLQVVNEKRQWGGDTCENQQSDSNDSFASAEEPDVAHHKPCVPIQLSQENFGPFQCLKSQSRQRIEKHNQNKSCCSSGSCFGINREPIVTPSENGVLVMSSSRNSGLKSTSRCKFNVSRPKCMCQRIVPKKSIAQLSRCKLCK